MKMNPVEIAMANLMAQATIWAFNKNYCSYLRGEQTWEEFKREIENFKL